MDVSTPFSYFYSGKRICKPVDLHDSKLIMLVIGAGGLAKDLLHVMSELGMSDTIVFYDDVSNLNILDISRRFRVLRTKEDAKSYFKNEDDRFFLGIGKPALRKWMCEQFRSMGGILTTLSSPTATVGSYMTNIRAGTIILPLSIISNASSVGEGCLIHHRAVISHDCIVGDFCELSPGATLLGHVTVGEMTHIGANATIIPGVRIGSGCRIGAGSVVNHDVPDSKVVAGNPARVISTIEKDR